MTDVHLKNTQTDRILTLKVIKLTKINWSKQVSGMEEIIHTECS